MYCCIVVFHLQKPHLSSNGGVTKHSFDSNLLIEFMEGRIYFKWNTGLDVSPKIFAVLNCF